MSAAVNSRPIAFFGLPGSSWAFAIRIWLAIVVALYVGFWLELEAASSAAVTVTILALPTRGQVLGKAVFRLIATFLGVAASIVIVGIFAQTETLLLGAFATWLGVCVYAVGLLDGNRAYAAALSGYTVAIIAVQQIDSPRHVFESGMARGAAIIVGVLAILLVNDLLAAPDQHPRLALQLEALRRRVVGYARRMLAGETVPATTGAALLAEAVALRPEIDSLAAELGSAPVRSAAARTAMVGVVAELFAARALAQLSATPPALRERIFAELELDSGMSAAKPREASSGDRDGGSRDATLSALSWFAERLLQTDREVRTSLGALNRGSRPPQAWRAPLYRSHRIAAAGGIRATICFLLAATFLEFCGWSSADVSLSFVAIIIGLGATTPDARAFTTMAVVAAPFASLMAGVLEFVILDGATAFPLLAIALAPFVIGLALLLTAPNPILSGLGRFTLIFIVALLAPSNPQTYNPQAFLFSVLFLLLATGLLFATEILVPPVSRERRRQWLLASVGRDLGLLPSRQERRLVPEEAMFRDASRISQILAAGGNELGHEAVGKAMASFDQSAVLRLCEAELRPLTPGPLEIEVGIAHAALAERNPASIIASADTLREAASLHDIAVTGASASLMLASVAFRPKRPT